MRGLRAAIVLFLAVLLPSLSASTGLAQTANPFADWSAVVIAADYHAASGEPAKVFDNARIEIARALVGAGFSAKNVAQFSVRPHLYEEMPFAVDPAETLPRTLRRLTEATAGGCFVYLTSHGDPDGVVYGKTTLSPTELDSMLDVTCGTRPTVAVISACFSGVFVPALAGPNRMVMTAARPDRASFGRGEAEVYTYFDGCLLESLPTSPRLDVLAENTRACVARRETEMGMAPPSEPQVSIGPQIAGQLPALTLAPRPPG